MNFIGNIAWLLFIAGLMVGFLLGWLGDDAFRWASEQYSQVR